MSTGTWVALIGTFLANSGLVVGATWKLAVVIQKVITRLDGIKELMDLNNKHTEQRITSVEAMITTINQLIIDIQKRQTTMELEMRMTKRE